MKVGVVGVGAIGGWLAGRLALAGHDVTCLARQGSAEALRSGLTIREGGKESIAFPSVVERADEPRELVIIATKAMALADAAEAAEPWISPATMILPLQNGVPWWFVSGEPLRSVDPQGRMAAGLPTAQVIGGVVHAAARRPAPALIEVAHADRLLLGEPDGGRSERVDKLVDVFEGAGVSAEARDAIRRDIWYKLWGNMTINPLSALTRTTADQLGSDAGIRPFILAAMAEAAAIGAAIGCPIAQSGEERMTVTARLGAFRTSMLQDLEAGRPLEVEALVGAPREIGRRVGIATPTIDLLYALTSLLDCSARRAST